MFKQLNLKKKEKKKKRFQVKLRQFHWLLCKAEGEQWPQVCSCPHSVRPYWHSARCLYGFYSISIPVLCCCCGCFIYSKTFTFCFLLHCWSSVYQHVTLSWRHIRKQQKAKNKLSHSWMSNHKESHLLKLAKRIKFCHFKHQTCFTNVILFTDLFWSWLSVFKDILYVCCLLRIL